MVDGGALDSVFHVDPALTGVTASLADLTIRNGSGGLPYGGGGVLNRGTLALTRCRVADDGANGADPNPDDISVTVTTDLDGVPPTVTLVSSVADTGDGELEGCESVHRLAITQLLVTFSEAVLDRTGDSEPHDVTNPANYLLVAAGTDQDIDTLASGAVAGDDVPLPVASVTCDAGTTTGVPEMFALGQCAPLAVENGYFMRLKVRVDAAPGVTLAVTTTCELFSQLDCLGTTENLLMNTTRRQDTAGAWVQLAAPVSALASSLSAYCTSALSTGLGSAFTGYLDRIELVPTVEVVFVDGFDTGDTRGWTLQEPPLP